VKPERDKYANNCAACRFFALTQSNGAATGDCRRHAPEVVPKDGVALWPVVYRTEWCGDFECRSGSPAEWLDPKERQVEESEVGG